MSGRVLSSGVDSEEEEEKEEEDLDKKEGGSR